MASESSTGEIIGAAVGGTIAGFSFLALLLIFCCCPWLLCCGARRGAEEAKPPVVVAPAMTAVLVCPVCDNRMVTGGPKAPYCKYAKAHEMNLKPIVVNVPV